MNKKLTEKLWNKYPLLYKDKDASIQHSLIPFGFECGDGWYQIIDDLSAKLEKEIEKYIHTYPDDSYPPRAVQVKEKFGTLRFYMGGYVEPMDELIDEAERLSEVTCEVCGKPGTLRGKSWVQTLCNECTEKSNA